ncbi:MAG: aminoglycoside phosphotransferase family protein, partial [Thermomicrobiales bacterium]
MKLSPLTPDHETDVIALHHWSGRGMVELVDHLPDSGAMLLERLGEESLADEHWRTAVEVCADLVQQVSVPACDGLPRVTDMAAELANNLVGHWDRNGRPISRDRIDEVRVIVAKYHSDPTNLMVNWDMYPGNIHRGTRQAWIVIDPKPARGVPEYGVAPMFWRLIDRIESQKDFNWAFQTLVDRSNLDPVKLQDWTFVRVVDYWLWAISKGLTEDPLRCSRVLDGLERL